MDDIAKEVKAKEPDESAEAQTTEIEWMVRVVDYGASVSSAGDELTDELYSHDDSDTAQRSDSGFDPTDRSYVVLSNLGKMQIALPARLEELGHGSRHGPETATQIPIRKPSGTWSDSGVLPDEVTIQAGAVRRELNHVPVWWSTNLEVRQLRHRFWTVRMSLRAFLNSTPPPPPPPHATCSRRAKPGARACLC